MKTVLSFQTQRVHERHKSARKFFSFEICCRRLDRDPDSLRSLKKLFHTCTERLLFFTQRISRSHFTYIIHILSYVQSHFLWLSTAWNFSYLKRFLFLRILRFLYIPVLSLFTAHETSSLSDWISFPARRGRSVKEDALITFCKRSIVPAPPSSPLTMKLGFLTYPHVFLFQSPFISFTAPDVLAKNVFRMVFVSRVQKKRKSWSECIKMFLTLREVHKFYPEWPISVFPFPRFYSKFKFGKPMTCCLVRKCYILSFISGAAACEYKLQFFCIATQNSLQNSREYRYPRTVETTKEKCELRSVSQFLKDNGGECRFSKAAVCKLKVSVFFPRTHAVEISKLSGPISKSTSPPLKDIF